MDKECFCLITLSICTFYKAQIELKSALSYSLAHPLLSRKANQSCERLELEYVSL